MLPSLFIILIAFVLIWFTSDTIVRSVTRLSKQINLSPFSTSFILLGLLTSTPEFSIGVNSIIDGIPEVFVGNLLGGCIVLFLFISPFLAVVGNGVKVSHSISPRGLLFTLFVVMVPALVSLKGSIDFGSAVFMVALYCLLILFIREKRSISDQIMNMVKPNKRSANIYQLTKIVIGIAIIFFAGKLLVDNLIILAEYMHIHPYLIALLGLSIGSNLPELFIGVLSVLQKQKEITFGHYLGSAAANCFFMGILTIMNRGTVVINDHYSFVAPLFLGIGLILFYRFVHSRNDLSRKEGSILLGLYFTFVAVTILLNRI